MIYKSLNKFKLPNTEISRIFVFEKYIIITNKRTCIILSENLEIIQKYVDENTTEIFLIALIFYKYLLIGGNNGIIKIIDIYKGRFLYGLIGHGGKITDIKIYKDFIFSCSEDSSIRMWKDGKIISIFGGFIGHEDIILSIDISICGEYIVSSGTDCTIKVWKIPKICYDKNYKKDIKIIYPIFNSNKVHKSYITKVKFFGKLIISQSINKITIIKPLYDTDIYKSNINSDLIFVKDYYVNDNSIKFIIYNDKMIFNKENELTIINLKTFDKENINIKFTNIIKQLEIINKKIIVLYRNGEIETFKFK